jgi:predicted amidohydrolase YtcJ
MSEPATAAAHAPLPLVIVNARVWTADERRPWADAVLVRGEAILAVGSSAELRKRAGTGAIIVDAGGRMVVPLAATGRLSPGESADLAIVDRVADVGVATTSAKGAVMFAVDKGAVVVDRDGLVRARS